MESAPIHEYQTKTESQQRQSFELLVTEERIAEMKQRRAESGLAVRIGSDPVALEREKPLGSGGTKQVYAVVYKGRRYALALPGVGTDPSDIIKEKWEEALHEPENTDKIRALGLLTNPLCKTVKAEVNGVDFPVIVMKRYEDLPFEIRDSKNRKTSSIGATELVSAQMDDADILRLFDPLLEEIYVLLQYGVRLSSDSINLCVKNREAHFYFNDLGRAVFQPMDDETLRRYAEYYVGRAVYTFLVGLTHQEGRNIEKDHDFEKIGKMLLERVLDALSEGSSSDTAH